MQAPGQTSDTQTHRLKWKHLVPGNLEFSFFKALPSVLALLGFCLLLTPPPETCGSQEPPQDLSCSAAPTVVQPLRGAAPPPVVNGNSPWKGPLSVGQETAAQGRPRPRRLLRLPTPPGPPGSRTLF